MSLKGYRVSKANKSRGFQELLRGVVLHGLLWGGCRGQWCGRRNSLLVRERRLVKRKCQGGFL